MATRSEHDQPRADETPTDRFPAIPREPNAPAWTAPQHGLLDVHTLLTLLYVALAVAVWTASGEHYKDARMPILLLGIGGIAPYWYGTRKP